VIVLRLSQGRSPFRPDKQHFSHRLVQLGFRQTHAVLLIYLVLLTTGLSGVLLYYLEPIVAPLVLLQVGCILGVIALLEMVAKRQSTRSDRDQESGLGTDGDHA
jgi:UDP-GlcNAc:undecaprenyl-phosphate GlcNAc-1-phosphate transferase